jgi:tetratricopeptide (TPR) repeat protein
MNLNNRLHRIESSLLSYYEKALKKKLEKALNDNEHTQVLILSSELIEIDSSIASHYYLRGMAKYRLNRLTDAVDDLNTCINMAPNEFPDAYYYREVCKFNVKEFECSLNVEKKISIAFTEQ